MTIIAPIYEKWINWKQFAGGYLLKRYYEKMLKRCGHDLNVTGKPILTNLNMITIGNHVRINNAVQIAPRGEVKIDDYVVMSRGSQITAGGLDTSRFSGGVQEC